ncbi:hypothetical protein NDU88_001322 [Pleurodeles waltl]|uniref:Uncharacterized protein n=1 Tax=Pleurodeles waltl TaxID=8319 RepID=A0AAV7NAJ2_PLEWA|nr:hypothetical protein NDU88_001322 [Pleurodeles waltl]
MDGQSGGQGCLPQSSRCLRLESGTVRWMVSPGARDVYLSPHGVCDYSPVLCDGWSVRGPGMSTSVLTVSATRVRYCAMDGQSGGQGCLPQSSRCLRLESGTVRWMVSPGARDVYLSPHGVCDYSPVLCDGWSVRGPGMSTSVLTVSATRVRYCAMDGQSGGQGCLPQSSRCLRLESGTVRWMVSPEDVKYITAGAVAPPAGRAAQCPRLS